jgi:hypothetical protein
MLRMAELSGVDVFSASARNCSYPFRAGGSTTGGPRFVERINDAPQMLTTPPPVHQFHGYTCLIDLRFDTVCQRHILICNGYVFAEVDAVRSGATRFELTRIYSDPEQPNNFS